MDKRRRELLYLLSIAGSTLLTPLPDLDWERIENALIKPSQLDISGIESLEAINSHYWSLYLLTSFKSSILDGVLGQLKMLVQFAKGSHPTIVRQRLCALLSDLSQLAGEIFFDRHEYETAQSCYIFAETAAKEALAYDLWSCALVRHAFLPIYDKNYSDALPLLEGAKRLVQHGNSSLVTRFWVAAVEAEAQSGVHNLEMCQNALDRAYGVLEIKETMPSWIRFDSSRLPALRGACYTRLSLPELALPSLQEALQQFTQPSRRRGLVLVDLATTALLNHDIEQACNHTSEVINIIALSSSDFLRKALDTLVHQLEPFSETSSVKLIDQQLKLLG